MRKAIWITGLVLFLGFTGTQSAIANETGDSQNIDSQQLLQLDQDADQLEDSVDTIVEKKAGGNEASKHYIGIAGDTALTEENASLQREMNATVISKFNVWRNISIRPSVRIVDDPVFNVPVTYDFPRAGVSPYVGGGVSIQSGEGEEVSPLAVVGVDLPVTENVTANAALNATFNGGSANNGGNDTELRAVVGLGYNF